MDINNFKDAIWGLAPLTTKLPVIAVIGEPFKEEANLTQHMLYFTADEVRNGSLTKETERYLIQLQRCIEIENWRPEGPSFGFAIEEWHMPNDKYFEVIVFMFYQKELSITTKGFDTLRIAEMIYLQKREGDARTSTN